MKNNKKSDRIPKEVYSSILDKPVFLGEAAYLKDRLKLKGIKSKIKIEDTEQPAKDPVYTVWVRTKDVRSALKIRNTEFDQQEIIITDSQDAKPLKRKWFLKAMTAGILGIMTGARVGIKMHNKLLYLVFVLVLGLLCFLTTWWFVSKNTE